MNLVVIELEELKKLLRKIIHEELYGPNSPLSDAIGSVKLAQEFTGLRPVRIYQKIASKETSFQQEYKGCKVRFSRNKLVKWTQENRRGSYRTALV